MSIPVVQCEGVTKCFGDHSAVQNVSFVLEPGEVLSVLGPSGSGKTTLLRLIAGFEVPDAGEIRIDGTLVSGSSVRVPADRRNVGLVFQEFALFPHLTVAQNVCFGLQRLASPERRRRSAEVIELVKLGGLENRYPHELSGGQQQRVALARTLAPRPVAVLLDEPFSNLDADMRRQMRQEMECILRDHGIATVFVTHDREEAFAMADRIGVMNEGYLEQIDTPDAIYRSPATPSVAQLAGTCDFLSGEIRDGVAVTEIGEIPWVTTNGPIPDGTRVNLMVHPTDFAIMSDSQGRAVVLSREFRGDETILVIRLDSGATLRCRQSSDSDLAPGTRATLVPKHTAPLPAFIR